MKYLIRSVKYLLALVVLYLAVLMLMTLTRTSLLSPAESLSMLVQMCIGDSDPAEQRGGGGAQLVGGLLGQPDPDAVLFVLLGRAESDESQQDEDGDDAQLHVGEVVERFEQARLSVEDDVFVPPEVLDLSLIHISMVAAWRR